MPHGDLLLWWSPMRRGVLRPGDLRISRSLARSVRRFTTTSDTAFTDVIDACADPSRPGAWIDRPIRDAYVRLHELGWAHSVEVWDGASLVGGLYGVAIGSLFAGESMFHRATDASKVALVDLGSAAGLSDPDRRSGRHRTSRRLVTHDPLPDGPLATRGTPGSPQLSV